MNTYQHAGLRVPYTNSSGSTIASGTLVVLRSGTSGICGVTVADIANGETGQVSVAGVHALTAATGAITQYALVYRKLSDGSITTTSTSNTLAGYAYAAKTTAATTAYVVLNAVPGAG